MTHRHNLLERELAHFQPQSEARRSLARLYNQLQAEIRQMHNQPPIIVGRPQTPYEERLERLEFVQGLQNLRPPEPLLEKWSKITQEHAEAILQQRLLFDEEKHCWFSVNVPSHREYDKINLRHSTSWVKGAGLVGMSPWAHQLALIADGRCNELYSTLSTEGQRNPMQVSHLCHNGGCFNPYHLVVEPMEDNLQRNTCKGAKIVNAFGTTLIDPCTHGSLSVKRKCVLNEIYLNSTGYHIMN